MAAGASPHGGVPRGLFEGSIGGASSDVQRRPYHRNCSCALHGAKGGDSSRCGGGACSKVSYPLRRSSSEASLVRTLSSSTSPAPMPVAAPTTPRRLRPASGSIGSLADIGFEFAP